MNSETDWEEKFFELQDRFELYQNSLFEVLHALCKRIGMETATRSEVEKFLGVTVSERVWRTFVSWASL